MPGPPADGVLFFQLVRVGAHPQHVGARLQVPAQAAEGPLARGVEIVLDALCFPFVEIIVAGAGLDFREEGSVPGE